MIEPTFECPPDHRHGRSEHCYLHHKCRCEPCKVNHRDVMRQRRKEQAYGRYTRSRVSAAPARAYVQWLQRQGMGPVYISAASGVPMTTLSALLWGRPANGTGPTKKISRQAAARLMAVTPDIDLMGDGAAIDACGTRRRLQALARLGWTWTALAQKAGVSDVVIRRIPHQKRVLVRTAKTVRELYDELWATIPTASTPIGRDMIRRASVRAERNGWAPPLAWDDETIDDPNASPDLDGTLHMHDEDYREAVIEAALAGEKPDMTLELRREVVTILNERRWSATRIAEHLGCNPKTVERDRAALGLPIYLMNGTHLKDGTVAA